MSHLSNQQLATFSEVLLTLHSIEEFSQLPVAFADACTRLISCANASFNAIGLQQPTLAVARSRGIKVPVEEDSPLLRNMHEHALIQKIFSTPGRGVYMWSDFLDRRAYHRLNLYNEYYRRSDTQQQMCFELSRNERSCIIMAVNHVSRGEFTEQDRFVAGLLQPHLQATWQRVQRFQNLKVQSDGMIRLLDAEKIGCLLMNSSGKVLHISAHAQLLLSHYFPRATFGHSGIPGFLRDWIAALQVGDCMESTPVATTLKVSSSRGVLHLDCRMDATKLLPTIFFHEEVFAFNESTIAVYDLSSREREVTAWICRGKTNPEIASILGLSVRTIHKHVEHILAKLALENRQQVICKILGDKTT